MASGQVRLKGALLQTYVLSILIRSVMEVVFLCLQYFMYGIFLHPLYVCKAWPCPHPVNCYVSRPTEKNVFIVFMLAVSAVSLLLSVLELQHLGWRHCCRKYFLRKSVSKVSTLPRQLSLSPPPPSTPPPDFNQCVMGPAHFLPLPFPNHRLANQQNSDNMATEKHKLASAVEEENLLQMSCYPPAWTTAGSAPPHEDDYLSTDISCFSRSRDVNCLHGGPDRTFPNGGICQKDKRRFSRASGASSRRADDLAI